MTTKSRRTARDLVEEALARAGAPGGEGRLVFISLNPERARRTADGVDALRAAGVELSPIAGLPVSVKDLFDVRGEVTAAASAALRTRAPARADAPVIARLKRAGAVPIGRTNMTEFAFSGVGLNPQYGTPANPYDRQRRLIPGGSSSGAAVSVADGMAAAALGTDTGGSVRIPAALCGLVGFKPTQRRIPREGVFPLSTTLDSVGAIARTVACCAAVDAVLAGDAPHECVPADLSTRIIGVPRNFFLDGLDPHIARSFEAALSALSVARARLTEIELPELGRIAEVNARGGIAAAECHAFHRRLKTDFTKCDPRVVERILPGASMTSADYLDMIAGRAAIREDFERAHGAIDIILCPTVPITAPEIHVLEQSDEEYRRVNLLLLRNPSVVNFLDRCALSLPCHKPGEAPAGLMAIGRHMEDRALLSSAMALERILRATS